MKKGGINHRNVEGFLLFKGLHFKKESKILNFRNKLDAIKPNLVDKHHQIVDYFYLPSILHPLKVILHCLSCNFHPRQRNFHYLTLVFYPQHFNLHHPQSNFERPKWVLGKS